MMSTNFLDSGRALPYPKGDLFPLPQGADTSKYGAAAEWDNLNGAVDDVRSRYKAMFPFCVFNFGALGDGTTDDTAAFNSAIVAAGLAGGGVVVVPWTPYFYRLTDSLISAYDNVFIAGFHGRAALLKWDSSFTGNCIAIQQTNTYPALRFNTGVANLRLEPQGQVAAVVYTLRAYDCQIEQLRIDGPGFGAATGTGILLDYGGADPSDYGTGHRISKCTILGYKTAIGVAGANPERVTNTGVSGCFLYGENQASSVGISGLYDGACIHGNEIEGFTDGVIVNNQGCTLVANRYEANTHADLWIRTNAYNCLALGNHHANGSGGNVFESSTSQRQNYIWDGTLGFAAQFAEVVNRACRTSTGVGPVDKWYQYGESASPGYWAQLTGTSGGTNPFGESVTTRELAIAAGDFLLKIGTIANRSISFYVNSLSTLVLNRGTGENTLTTDANTLTLKSAVATTGTAVAHADDTTVALTNTGDKIRSFRTAGTEKAYVDKDGKIMGANLQAGSTGLNTVTCGTVKGGGQLTVTGNVSSSGSAVAVRTSNNAALTNAGDQIEAWFQDAAFATKVLAVDRTGKLIVPNGIAGAAVVGTATLVGGTVTVSTTAVTAASKILISRATAGGTVGDLRLGTITAGTSFVISSLSGTDTSTVNWWIIN